MTRWSAILLCALAIGFVLGSHFGSRTQLSQRPPLLQAEDVRPTKDNKVTDSDADLYIAVYSAMQADHGLTIEEAVASRHISLDEFRELERRVQSDQRMVDKVRLALLNQAKAHSDWTTSGVVKAKPDSAPESQQ